MVSYKRLVIANFYIAASLDPWRFKDFQQKGRGKTNLVLQQPLSVVILRSISVRGLRCGRAYAALILMGKGIILNMKRKVVFAVDGIMSGILLCAGCAASMSAESGALGSFLFSLGLCTIIKLGFGLYTGKAGYMVVNPPSYIIEVLLTLAGNIVGTAIGGTLLRLTRFGSKFTGEAASVINGKFSDSPLSTFVLAVFCGILMFIAVDGSKRSAKKGDFVSSLFLIVIPVMFFITCGFNHCVADLAYFFISGCSYASGAVVYFLFVILGNAVGCMMIPFMKRVSYSLKRA